MANQIVIYTADKLPYLYDRIKRNKFQFEILEDAYCHETFYHLEKKEPIPKGTILSMDDYYENYYGGFIKCTYNGKVYYIEPIKVKINSIIEVQQNLKAL